MTLSEYEKKLEAGRQAEFRKQGIPVHVFPHVRRKNSWQARYWLRRSMEK